MQQYIDEFVRPQWAKSLSRTSDNERKNGITHHGKKYVWSRFLKDVQRFYRLVFKHRFHRLDKRDNLKSEILARKMIYELGIEHSGDYTRMFHYFYSRLNKLRKTDM
jgi:hypothetical protein